MDVLFVPHGLQTKTGAPWLLRREGAQQQKVGAPGLLLAAFLTALCLVAQRLRDVCPDCINQHRLRGLIPWDSKKFIHEFLQPLAKAKRSHIGLLAPKLGWLCCSLLAPQHLPFSDKLASTQILQICNLWFFDHNTLLQAFLTSKSKSFEQ